MAPFSSLSIDIRVHVVACCLYVRSEIMKIRFRARQYIISVYGYSILTLEECVKALIYYTFRILIVSTTYILSKVWCSFCAWNRYWICHYWSNAFSSILWLRNTKTNLLRALWRSMLRAFFLLIYLWSKKI